MKKLIYILTLWLSATLSAQVTGNAQLLGQSNHSGIKVLFTAVSPTAKTDSTYTNAAGDYSKTLSGGTYSVKFKKVGYYDSTYKQNVFVNGASKLDTISLISTKYVFVGGTASGIWDSSHIYVIRNNFVGENLTINEGCKIFINYSNISYPNYLQFSGTINFSGSFKNPIRIFSDKTDTQIKFFNISEIKHIETGIMVLLSCESIPDLKLKLLNSNLKNCKILCGVGSIYLLNNYIDNLEIEPRYSFSHPDNTISINCNKIGNIKLNQIYDIKLNTIEFNNNFIFDSIPSSLIIASYFSKTGNSGVTKLPNTNFSNNFFQSKNLNLYVGSKHKLLFVNNTFLCDYTNIKIGDLDSGVVHNNIFNNLNINSIYKNPIITKNQILTVSDTSNIPGLGIPILKNSQGSNIDTYLNVIEDPQFSKAPLLSPSSPMIGAGLNGSNIGFDPAGTCLESYFDNWPGTHDADTLSISGKVSVAGVSQIQATVAARNTTSNHTFSTNTDASGNFVLDSLPLGNYIITTTPLGDLANNYDVTYYPKQAHVENADTVTVQNKIVDMKIYLVYKALGVFDEQLQTGIYPNPFKDQLTVANPNKVLFTISDISGRVLHQSSQDHETIDTQNWNQGLYFVKINSKVIKFIKE